MFEKVVNNPLESTRLLFFLHKKIRGWALYKNSWIYTFIYVAYCKSVWAIIFFFSIFNVT